MVLTENFVAFLKAFVMTENNVALEKQTDHCLLMSHHVVLLCDNWFSF